MFFWDLRTLSWQPSLWSAPVPSTSLLASVNWQALRKGSSKAEPAFTSLFIANQNNKSTAIIWAKPVELKRFYSIFSSCASFCRGLHLFKRKELPVCHLPSYSFRLWESEPPRNFVISFTGKWIERLDLWIPSWTKSQHLAKLCLEFRVVCFTSPL